MSSNTALVSQQVYFSTHNALREDEGESQKIQVQFFELRGNRHINLAIYPFYDVQMVKRLLIKHLGLPLITEVKDISILYRGAYLPNYRVMNTFEKKAKHKLYWFLDKPNNNIGIRELGMKPNWKLQLLMSEILLAFKRNITPKLTMDGTGGTYMLYDANGCVNAIFKPSDEEAFAPLNPRGYQGKLNQQGFRAGVLSGEGSSREVAAYLMDSAYGGVSGVPATVMVEIAHPGLNNFNSFNLSSNKTRKTNNITSSFFSNYVIHNLKGSEGELKALGKAAEEKYQVFSSSDKSNINKKKPNEISTKWKAGSLQEYIEAKETCGNFDSCVFNVFDVQKIGMIDIRLMNLDRNDGNILVAPMHSLKSISSSSTYLSTVGSSALSAAAAYPSISTMKNRSTADDGSGIGRNADFRKSGIFRAGQDKREVCKMNSEKLSWNLKTHEQLEAEGLLTPEGKQSKYKLIPIDHGLILPDVMDVANIDVVWYAWPQAKLPFRESLLRIIFSFDADKDAERLKKKLFIRDECVRTMRVSTRLLQIGAYMHLNLHQIAVIHCRQNIDELSPLEILVKSALSQTYITLDSTSLISSNRLGYTIDLANSVTTSFNRQSYKKSCFAESSDVEKSGKRKKERILGNKKNKLDKSYICSDNSTSNKKDNKKDLKNLEEKEEKRKYVDSSSFFSSYSSDSSFSKDSASDSFMCSDEESKTTSSCSLEEDFCSTDESHCFKEDCVNKQEAKADGKENKFFEDGVVDDTTKEKKKLKKKNANKLKKTKHNQNSSSASHFDPFKSSRGSVVRSRMNNTGTGGVRVTTAYRLKNETLLSSNSTWSLQDMHGRLIPLNWSDSTVDKLFFEVFEERMLHYINEKHPDWMSYDFFGANILENELNQSNISLSLKACKRFSQSLFSKSDLSNPATNNATTVANVR